MQDAPPVGEGFSHLLISRRSRQYFNSSGHQYAALQAKGTTNHAHIHPDDLAALGLPDGATVEIASARGSLFGIVKATDTIKPGVISMAHAFGDFDTGKAGLAAKGNSTNRLVADDVDYDPITGHTRQSAIPVNVRAAG